MIEAEKKERILREVLRILNEKYPVGLYEFLFANNRPLYNAILKAEDKADEAFLNGTVADLKAVLREYWRLHIEAIKQFEQKGRPVSNAQTRREMEEKPMF